MHVSAEDFERLSVSSMELDQSGEGPLYERQLGRFEFDGNFQALPNREQPYRWGHWMEDGWASVMFAKQFLLDNGHEFEVAYDTSYPTDWGGWVIFTDYHRE